MHLDESLDNLENTDNFHSTDNTYSSSKRLPKRPPQKKFISHEKFLEFKRKRHKNDKLENLPFTTNFNSIYENKNSVSSEFLEKSVSSHKTLLSNDIDEPYENYGNSSNTNFMINNLDNYDNQKILQLKKDLQPKNCQNSKIII